MSHSIIVITSNQSSVSTSPLHCSSKLEIRFVGWFILVAILMYIEVSTSRAYPQEQREEMESYKGQNDRSDFGSKGQ